MEHPPLGDMKRDFQLNDPLGAEAPVLIVLLIWNFLRPSRIRHSILALFVALLSASASDLAPLRYNNPGLAVDLGVGLWSAPIPCDADGDGDFDLIVVCHDKPYQGTYLFENTSGDTAKNKLPVFKAARRLGKGVENAMPSYVDGRLRVLTPGFEHPNFLKIGLDAGVKLPTAFSARTSAENTTKLPFKLRGSQWRYVDLDGGGRLDLVNGVGDWSAYRWDNAYDAAGNWTNGPLHGFVYWLRNTNSSAAPAYAKPAMLRTTDGQPIDVFGMVSPSFCDFNGDGDLDLLCGEFLDGFTYFENVGSKSDPRFAAGRRVKMANGNPVAMDLCMIVPVAFDWDKDGDFDLIVGDEDGRVAFVENTGKLDASLTPVFKAPVYFQQEADQLKSGALATPVAFDWDGDGDLDILSGNTAGYIEFFENVGQASSPGQDSKQASSIDNSSTDSPGEDARSTPKWAAPRRLEAGGKVFRIMAGPNRSIQGPAETKWGYTTFTIADWDGDGLPDIVLNSILGEVVWLKNVGTRKAPRLEAAAPIEVEWTSPQPKLAWGWWKPQGKALLTQWRTTPLAHDFTGDGLVDLAMLDHEGFLVLFERAKQDGKLILKHPHRVFLDEQGAPLRLTAKTAGGSGRRKLAVTDWDGDGRFDLLLNSANANFLRQVDQRDGKWIFRDMGALSSRNIEGHDVSPGTVDFDADGVPDFLGGAEDGRFYYLKNPRSN